MEQKLHFIGIGGIGMSAIALILLHDGFTISGSDVKQSPITERLTAYGALISYGHADKNIPADCQAVVYSSAVKDDNAEMQEARRRGLPIYRRAEMLAYLMSQRRSIGVAGAHGKTTTSAMIAIMLTNAGCDPTAIIGGTLTAFGGNARAGNGELLSAEADESDGTFLMLHPAIPLVTNVEADHLDYYGDFEHVKAAFAQYLAQTPADGYAVINTDCPVCREFRQNINVNFVTYALDHDADYTAKNIVFHTLSEGLGSSSDIYYRGQKLGRLRLNVPGVHNVSNALAAIAIGMTEGLDFAACAAGLAGFAGTGRRFEQLGHVGDILVVDDYAHHPTEVETTVRSARTLGVKKLYSVFQPHRYSRTQVMYRDFAAALLGSDSVMIVELYPAFEEPIEGVSARLVVDAMHEMGYDKVKYAPNVETAVSILRQDISDEDMLLIMGAGNVRAVGEGYLRTAVK